MRYQSTTGPRASDVESAKGMGIPSLVIVGGQDGLREAEEALWVATRASGAPWTFLLQPDATHGDPDYLDAARDLVIPWITAVLRQRLSADGSALREITESSGWLGNRATGEIAPYAAFSGSKTEANWFPDEASAHGWQAVIATTPNPRRN